MVATIEKTALRSENNTTCLLRATISITETLTAGLEAMCE
jgi:hypothetical protein